MIGSATVIACIVTLLISLVLPIAAMIVYGIKNKGKGIYTAWFLGGSGFFIMQILLRSNILTILAGIPGFQSFTTNHYVLYCLMLGFTAGLFELAARFFCAKFMGKELIFERAVSAGMGHGGIEAMLIIGVAYINNLIYISMINSGAFEGIIQQTAAMGVDVSQLYALQDALINTSPVMFLLAGFERILAMTAHIAMTVVVCYAVQCKRPVPGMLLCLAVHTAMDSVSAIVSGLSTDILGNVLSQTTAYIIIYTFLTAIAVASVLVLKEIHKRWPTPEKEEDDNA